MSFLELDWSEITNSLLCVLAVNAKLSSLPSERRPFMNTVSSRSPYATRTEQGSPSLGKFAPLNPRPMFVLIASLISPKVADVASAGADERINGSTKIKFFTFTPSNSPLPAIHERFEDRGQFQLSFNRGYKVAPLSPGSDKL